MHTIRAGLNELDSLVSLFEAYRKFYRKEPDGAGAQAFIRQRLENHDSVIFMAYSEEDRAVGFTQLYPLFTSLRMKEFWLLNDLYVEPDYRGRGLAGQLIEEAKALASQTSAAGLMLETEKSNRIGNQLYPKMGFVLNKESNFYYWDCPVST